MPAAELHLPETFAIKPGYVANLVPAYFDDDTSDGVVWQPDVYPLAARIARALGCPQLVDIGCGRGGKLEALRADFAFDIVGLDYGANLAFCREHYPWGHWQDLDLEHPPAGIDQRWAHRPSGIVCADVIEHLIDPRGLLRFIKSLLATSPFVALSTPERDLRRGADHMGPPLNRCHVREWTLGELQGFCRAAELDVAWAGLTRAHTRTTDKTTALVLLVSSDASEAVRATVRDYGDAHSREN